MSMDALVTRRTIAGLLLLSGLLLCSLVPGGPVENRDFSALSPALLLAFNVALTALGLGSFLLVAGVLRGQSGALRLSFWAGAAYVVIYGIDLLGWFPPTPSAMSEALVAVELAGLLVAMALLWVSVHGQEAGQRGRAAAPMPAAAILALSAVAMMVVAFATVSALRGA
jgi:hypothetical protein